MVVVSGLGNCSTLQLVQHSLSQTGINYPRFPLAVNKAVNDLVSYLLFRLVLLYSGLS